MPTEKTCTSCGMALPLEQFHKAKLGLYGRAAACKKCRADKHRDYMATEAGLATRKRLNASLAARKSKDKYAKSPSGRATRSAAKAAYRSRPDGLDTERRYRQSESAKESARKAALKWQSDNQEKVRAHRLVAAALAAGTIKPAKECDCERCGSRAQQLHHAWGYEGENALRVQPLCRKCHKAVHAEPRLPFVEERPEVQTGLWDE